MSLAWKIIALTVLQTIFLAVAVAIYAEPANPYLFILLSSAGPWVGAFIGAIRAPS